MYSGKIAPKLMTYVLERYVANGYSMLLPAVQSVYADIAMMIGNYTKQILGLDKDKMTTEIADMHIMAALVANDAGNEQTLRTSAKLDKDTKSLACSFLSVDVSPRAQYKAELAVSTYMERLISVSFLPHRATENKRSFMQPVLYGLLSSTRSKPCLKKRRLQPESVSTL